MRHEVSLGLFCFFQTLIHTMSNKLPDGGAQLRAQKQAILNRMAVIKRPIPEIDLTNTATSAPAVSQPTVVAEVTFQYYILCNACVPMYHFCATIPQHHTLCKYLQPLISSSPSLPHSTTTRRVS